MTTAAATGRCLEDIVENMLSGKGFQVVRHAHYSREHRDGRFLVKRVPYETIYGTTGHTEFLLVDGGRKVRIECKWQQSSGSVDEKYPYLLKNCTDKMPESEIIIILGGGGYKQAARQWLVKACESITDKSVKVMSVEEFIAWANLL